MVNSTNEIREGASSSISVAYKVILICSTYVLHFPHGEHDITAGTSIPDDDVEEDTVLQLIFAVS